MCVCFRFSYNPLRKQLGFVDQFLSELGMFLEDRWPVWGGFGENVGEVSGGFSEGFRTFSKKFRGHVWKQR